MNLNKNVTMPKSEEKESGIEETPIKLKNQEWIIIGERKIWIRKCPVCDVETQYKRKYSLNRAKKLNRTCVKCANSSLLHKQKISLSLKGIKRSDKFKNKISDAMKGRKITWMYKIIPKLKGRSVSIEHEMKRLESRLGMSYDEYLERKPKFFSYKSRVMSITKRQNIKILNNYNEIRALAGTKNGYQLDHIITIYDGFENNISPYIIGNINNLRFIPWEENLKKNKTTNVVIESKHINNIIDEIQKEMLNVYSKYDNQLYKIMSAVTDAWYENPNITREEALVIVRKIANI